MINLIYDAGLSQLVRALIIYFALTLAFVFIGRYAKRLGLSATKAVFTSTLGYSFMILCALPACFGLGTISGEDYLLDIFYVPMTMIHGLPFYMIASVPLCKLFKIDHRMVNDLSAMAFILCQGISHTGCIFVGCCSGYPSEFGIYNCMAGERLFPVQLFDGASCILLFFAFLYYFKRKKYNTGGYIYPLMLICYGIIRLCWEFARDNLKVCGPFSINSLYCFLMIAVGLISFIILRAYNREKMSVIGLKNRRKSTGRRRK